MPRTMPPHPRMPSRFPVGIMTGIFLALLVCFAAFRQWKSRLPPLQQFYLMSYSMPTFALPGKPRQAKATIIFAGDQPATPASFSGAPNKELSVRRIDVHPALYHRWLKSTIYGGQDLQEVLFIPVFGSGLCVFMGVIGGCFVDAKRIRIRRNGLKLKGPDLLTVQQYNHLTKGDGIAFQLATKGSQLALRRRHEAQNFFIAGDIGTGKSSIIRQVLNCIEERGETAVILDSQREFLPRYFVEGRGDLVLNPKDERCPYWHIGSEAEDEADAIAVARSLFPEPPADSSSKFFHSHTVGIFSYLLAYYHPAPNELGHWMAHPAEIDARVRGTEHQHTLTANAPPQRAGILGTLNEAGRSLRMMPASPEGRRQFTVREWCKKREGWLFITNTQDTRDAIRPIQSMWLDLLLLRLMSMGEQPQLKRVWIILDELASLQTLPQLHTAITESRKTDHPLVVGIQNVADLDSLYNKKAKTIFSQALTKFVLATSEPASAKSLSELIGEVEILRLKETRSTGGLSQGRNSETVEEIRKPLVMPSEIQGLPDLEGYFLQRGKVVRVRLPYVDRKATVPALIERKIPPMDHRPLVPEEAADDTAKLPNSGDASEHAAPVRPSSIQLSLIGDDHVRPIR